MAKPKKEKKKQEEVVVSLNEELMDNFASSLEEAINSVIEQMEEGDPRAELLVTLGLMASQVSNDSGYTKDEFLDLMGELFEDFKDAEKEHECQKCEDCGGDCEDEEQEASPEINFKPKKDRKFDLN